VKPAQHFFFQFFGEKLSEFSSDLFFIKEVKNIDLNHDYENSSDSDEQCPEIVLKREISEEDKEQFFFLEEKLTNSPQKQKSFPCLINL